MTSHMHASQLAAIKVGIRFYVQVCAPASELTCMEHFDKQSSTFYILAILFLIIDCMQCMLVLTCHSTLSALNVSSLCLNVNIGTSHF